MQDRFRVRLWDITKQKFIKVTEIDYYTDGEEVTVYYDGDTFETVLDEGYLKACFLEQCTGLKDKNGKLIYEGDIARAIYSDGITEFGLPIYHNRQGGFSVGFYNSDAGWLDEDFVGKIEVIGNIHENPELLEEK